MMADQPPADEATRPEKPERPVEGIEEPRLRVPQVRLAAGEIGIPVRHLARASECLTRELAVAEIPQRQVVPALAVHADEEVGRVDRQRPEARETCPEERGDDSDGGDPWGTRL